VSDHRIHEAAARGFEAAVDRYERGRPSYPDDAVALLVDRLGIGPGRDVLELGAGTGKFTELLVPSGATITAREPVAAMRERLAARCPTVTVVDGTAESIPLGDASVDIVVAAQAFHWFDGVRALTEIHRVLRPDGGLGLIWNARDEGSAWERRITEIFDRVAGDGPRYRDLRWRDPLDRSDLFGPLRSWQTRHVHEVSPDEFVDRMLSVSYVASASEPERARVVAEVTELLATDPELAGERIRIPYRTDVFWTRQR
jgi:SAM-dependent methyltransferase